MRIPETPASVSDLDLMKHLQDYAEGRASWYPDDTALGENAKKACRRLHTDIVALVEQVFAFIMDRSTARELDTFTMHDRVHGRKSPISCGTSCYPNDEPPSLPQKLECWSSPRTCTMLVWPSAVPNAKQGCRQNPTSGIAPKPATS